MDPLRRARLLQISAGMLWCGLCAVAAVLLLRRLQGAIAQPFPASLAVLWFLMALAWSGAALALYRWADLPPVGRFNPRTALWPEEGVGGLLSFWPEAGSLALAVTAALAVASPGDSLLISGLTGLVLLVVTLAACLVLLEADLTAGLLDRPAPATPVARRPSKTPQPVAVADDSAAAPVREILPWPFQTAADTSSTADDHDDQPDLELLNSQNADGADDHDIEAEEGDDVEADEDDLDPSATQTFTRRITDRAEIIEGVMTIELAPEQREVQWHLSFCPPLAGSPEIWLGDVDGGNWDLKVAAVYPFGARLGIRRRPDSPTRCRIAYTATAPLRHVG